MVISKQQSRYAALFVLVVAVFLAIGLLCYPFVSLYSSQAAALARAQDQVARYQQLADGQDSLQKELALLKRRSPTAAYYVAGDTAALASAKMQQYLKQIVVRNGGELISTQIVTPDESNAGSQTSLKVRLRASMEKSPLILHALENGRPLLFLDNLVISSRQVRRTTAGAPTRVSLDMSFDLTGFIEGGA
jgi:general secretion pathway protein M